ncbi:autotransporter domain-containing protein [Sphingomonas cannabina]|uniref:autotransporter outer membrane beta-barrel domain-containing protein n=1 Tax=Sphingomonas cannabina TaxID=2899123 RepID=UPI001F361866|nr:autotransporter outer membrane beta-barrel domain-containing protein [Sphingomonas cannabina]UIJ46843.1 autotransporter domain-containing protein [Sphingomonas cannabina]
MRRYLLASTALAAMAAPAAAQTNVDTARTTPISTSTIKNGTPDAINITDKGSVKPASGTAVTVDTNHAVTNGGTIQITNSDGAIGIGANAGTGGGITNNGAITIDETYTAADADNDGDADGPFAVGGNRAGIRTQGAYTGNIVNGTAGVITVEGNDSAGIRLGGPLTGNFTHDGKTTVIGDRSIGVDAGAINGNVRLAGTVTAQGKDAIGARFAGDISGAMVVQGTISSSGYRFPTAPTDTSKLDGDDLLQGGSALIVSGNVGGGIIFAVPPKDNSTTDNDEDKDGIEDSKEGSAAVSSQGAAPAVVIGATDRAITIGPVAGTGTGFGIIIDGTIKGDGVYSGIDGNGLVIGGRGGAVTVAGGMGISGTVSANSNGASATAIRIGAQATVPEIRNSGTISAAGGKSTTSLTTAILIDQGASVGTIRNSGTIKAVAGGDDGTATAILDRSGSVVLVENSGTISASGAKADSTRNVAIDLSANTSGATVRQTAVASGVTAPSITGDIRFGTGNDVLDIADGAVKGNVSFGAGNNRLALSGDGTYTGAATFGAGNDTLALTGTSKFTGSADFGGGSDVLTIDGGSLFAGSLANAGGLAVTVTNGAFDVTKTASIASLNVGASGVLAVTLDKTGGTGTMINVAGNASFADGATLALKVASIKDVEGHYVVLQAGSLTGADKLKTSSVLLPYLLKGTLNTSVANQLAVDVVRKTTTELELNRSESSAFNAIYTALGTDQKVGDAFLNITDGEVFRGSLRQLLPDHAGGAFEAATQGSRSVARMVSDPHGPFKDEGNWGYWVTSTVWGTSKDRDATAGYNAGGWTAAGGVETKTGFGNVGVYAAYMWSQDNDNSTDNDVMGNQYELGSYWKGRWNGFAANVRASLAKIDFDSTRRFDGSIGTEAVSRVAKGSWGGKLTSFSAAVSHESGGAMFFIRPSAAVDYYKLKEDGYTETGGGTAMNLTVAGRTSDELAVTGAMAAGIDFMGFYERDEGWFRVEAEGGRRQIVGGELGVTKAHFQGGETFTLVPEDRTNGWVGKLRAMGGNNYFRLVGEASAEEQQDRFVLGIRASLQIGL